MPTSHAVIARIRGFRARQVNLQVCAVHKAYLKLGSVEVDIWNLKGKKRIFWSSYRGGWSWELKLVVRVLGKYTQNTKIKIKIFEPYFWSKCSSRTKIFRCFLDLLEEKSSSKSKKYLKILVRDENFDQKYVSKNFISIFFILYIFSKYSHNKFQLPTPPSPVARAKSPFFSL